MTQKITFRGRGSRQDEIDARNASRLDASNPFVMGVQVGVGGGPDAVKGSRTAYGAPRHMPQDLDPTSNFSQSDAPANKPQDDPLNQTGDLQLATSATRQPNRDQDALNAERLERRLQLYAGKMNATDQNLNNLQEVGRLG